MAVYRSKPKIVKTFDGYFRVLHQREWHQAINFGPSSIKLMLYARYNR